MRFIFLAACGLALTGLLAHAWVPAKPAAAGWYGVDRECTATVQLQSIDVTGKIIIVTPVVMYIEVCDLRQRHGVFL